MNLKDIKHQFFVYRNGIVADTLRRSGMPYKMIFGLDVPTIASIARQAGESTELAEALWADSEVRESRLLATYLFSHSEIDEDRAVELASEARTQEEADMLAFRIFKRLPFAVSLLERLEARDDCRRAARSLKAHLD